MLSLLQFAGDTEVALFYVINMLALMPIPELEILTSGLIPVPTDKPYGLKKICYV